MSKEHISVQILLDQQPDLKELTTHARTARWYQLGVELELDNVDLAGCTDLARMYELWIQQKAEMATRRNLLTALRSIRENNVAFRYEDYLRRKVSNPIFNSNIVNPIPTQHVVYSLYYSISR